MVRTSTTWESVSTWRNGKTTTVRVPIVLKNEILDYARAVDSNLINDVVPLRAGDFLQQFTLAATERYIEFKRQNYHPNQNARILDTSTRAWDELRKFQKLLRDSPELFKTSVKN